MVTLPPTFIRLRLEFGGCWQHTRLRPRGAVAARGALARVRIGWRRRLAQADARMRPNPVVVTAPLFERLPASVM
jgi:hypothetical protein